MNFLLARVAELVDHARFLKSTILIKIGNMSVELILMGRKCDKSSKYTHTHTNHLPHKVTKICNIVNRQVHA